MFNNKRNYKLFFYTTPLIKFRSFSYNYKKNVYLQKGHNLGEKIWHVRSFIKDRFVLIGSDIPEIKFEYLNYAFQILKTKDVVIGPTYDNGFWLIGFSNKKSIIYPFKNIRWSSQYTLDDLMNNLEAFSLLFSAPSPVTYKSITSYKTSIGVESVYCVLL